MKLWMRLGIGVAALALAVGVGVGAAAKYGYDDTQKTHATGAPESGDDASAAGGGGGLAMTCLVGATDCNDTPGVAYNDFGDTSQKCAADAPTCIEPAAPAECVYCPAMTQQSCKSGIAPDGTTYETCIGCGYSEPVPGELVDPVAPTDPAVDLPLPVPTLDPAVGGPATDFQVAPDSDPAVGAPNTQFPLAPGLDPAFAGTGCLGIDPCSISSRQLCVPCAASSYGPVDCPPLIPACEILTSPPAGTDGSEGSEVKPIAPDIAPDVPCVVSPCLGNDPLAGIPAECPSNPCTIYSSDKPEGVPCPPIEPCIITTTPSDTKPSEPAPDDAVQNCQSTPGSAGGGSSGSSGSSSGSGTNSSGSGGSSTNNPTTDAPPPPAE